MGWADITDVLEVRTSRTVNMENDGATVVVRAAELTTPGVSFAGNVVISAVHGGLPYVLFTGVVDKVSLTDGQVAHIEVASLKRQFETTRIAGLQIGDGCDGREIIHALARQAGLADERINIQGWVPGPSETFLIAVPITGVSIGCSREIAGVLFTNTNPANLELPDGEIRQQYLAGPCWAAALVEATTLSGAEAAGLERIRTACAVIRCASYYSYPTLDGALRPFDWRHTQVRPWMAPVVFVGSVTSRRRWLRIVQDLPNVESLDLDELAIPREKTFALGLPAKRALQRALREWHASVDANDEVGRVAHLWRAMECYVAGVRSERLFEPAQVRAISEAVRSATSMNSDQSARVDEIIGRLNEAPLLRKLRTAVTRDGTVITEAEFAALAATRALRNDLEHGRSLSGAQLDELDVATAVANRIIMAALAALAAAS